MKYASVVVLVVLLSSSLMCAQATDLYTLGNGQDACSAWLKFRQNEHVHEGQVKWILGFLTGSNYRTEGQGAPADSAAVEAFVDQYCQNNPSHQLFRMAFDMPASQRRSTPATATCGQRRPTRGTPVRKRRCAMTTTGKTWRETSP